MSMKRNAVQKHEEAHINVLSFFDNDEDDASPRVHSTERPTLFGFCLLDHHLVYSSVIGVRINFAQAIGHW